MFQPSLEPNEEGTYTAPHIEVIWMYQTDNQTTIFDSDIGFVEPDVPPETSTPATAEGEDSKIPTVSLLGQNGTEVGNVSAEVGPTEKPFGWSEPEPDYVKFQLPFNSPHASKFQGLKFNYGEVSQ